MAKYAYRDKQRKDVIYSTEAIKEDRYKVFYCPNPKCNAQLYICAIDGSRTAYFRATKSQYPHIPNCPFGNSSTEFDENQFDESKFVFDDAIENLFDLTKFAATLKKMSGHGTGEPQKHPARTIKQIYSICKSLPVKTTYGDKEVGEMLLDDRSEYRYPRGVFGNRIIEAVAKGRFYDNDKKQIYLAAPMDSKRYTFILAFLDDGIYRIVRNEIFNNRDKIVVVAGKWKASSTYNSFITEVHGQKQVTIIKL